METEGVTERYEGTARRPREENRKAMMKKKKKKKKKT